MRVLLAVLLAALSAAVSAEAQQAPRPAPEFHFHMLQGPDTLLSGFRGKVVMVAFLNTGCTHCQHFAQELSQFQKDYGPRGVQVVAAVFDNGARAGLQSFKDQFVRGFPIGYSDEKTVLSWLGQPVEEGYFVPIVAFVDRKGAIVSQHLGDDNLFQDPDASIRHTLDLMLKRPASLSK
ncbi:MAG: TlpA disulfide reductase family protein [Bryobacteraceae bacterium]|jgi:thiol-disulfide isomerase/thioredoxin